MTRLYNERDLPPDAWGQAWDGPEIEPCCACADVAKHNLADMTRQRDEAVKAFQRERARVGRVEALAEDMATWCSPYGIATHYADSLRAALTDRPTDE